MRSTLSSSLHRSLASRIVSTCPSFSSRDICKLTPVLMAQTMYPKNYSTKKRVKKSEKLEITATADKITAVGKSKVEISDVEEITEEEEQVIFVRRRQPVRLGTQTLIAHRPKFANILNTLRSFRDEPLALFTDPFCHSAIHTWPKAWIKRDWVNSDGYDVANEDYILDIITELHAREKPVKWVVLEYKDLFKSNKPKDSGIENEEPEKRTETELLSGAPTDLMVGDVVSFSLPGLTQDVDFYAQYADAIKEWREAKDDPEWQAARDKALAERLKKKMTKREKKKEAKITSEEEPNEAQEEEEVEIEEIEEIKPKKKAAGKKEIKSSKKKAAGKKGIKSNKKKVEKKKSSKKEQKKKAMKS